MLGHLFAAARADLHPAKQGFELPPKYRRVGVVAGRQRCWLIAHLYSEFYIGQLRQATKSPVENMACQMNNRSYNCCRSL